MSRNRLHKLLGLGLATSMFLLGPVPSLLADTECNTDPDAVFFEATVDPSRLNDYLIRRGQLRTGAGRGTLTIPGLCVDHQIGILTGRLDVPVDTAPFTVTPSLGGLGVELFVSGPFEIGVDGGIYSSANCSSSCVVELPYVGEVFNGCELESDIVRPLLRLLQASASWDDMNVTQVADTCVLGDCTAAHPLESTDVNFFNFDIDLTGFGSCEICSQLPPEIRFLCDPIGGSFDPCQGIDPLLEALLVPTLEDIIANVFENLQGQGVLIQVFSNQIRTDFGCIPIPEVRDCRAQQTGTVARLLQGLTNRGLNTGLYLLPLFLVGGLVIRHRRRR